MRHPSTNGLRRWLADEALDREIFDWANELLTGRLHSAVEAYEAVADPSTEDGFLALAQAAWHDTRPESER